MVEGHKNVMNIHIMTMGSLKNLELYLMVINQ